MAQCDECGKSVYRTTFMVESKKWLGVECGCKKEAFERSAFNPWSDVTLEHIHDETGKPIRVTSVRQLREAEQRYGFKHHLANQNEEHFNVAPQHRSTTVGDHYKRKFSMGA